MRLLPGRAATTLLVLVAAPRCFHVSGASAPERPATAAGFALGQSLAQAREICERDGRVFEGNACSGTVRDTGLDARVELNVCCERVCGITIVSAPPLSEGARWQRELEKVRSTLFSKYGQAHERRVRWPPRCRTPENFVSCLQAGTAEFVYEWTWDQQYSLELALGRRTGQALEQRVTYRRLSTPPCANPT